MIWTEDLHGTADFYAKTLGFTVFAVNEELGWASLRREGAAIMLSQPNQHEYGGKISFTGSFYFNVADVDTVWDDLKDKAKICYGIESFDFGMREFAIYDNNGYLLQFGQEISD